MTDLKPCRDKALTVFVPVACHNGHMAVASFRWDAMRLEYIYESVPKEQKCDCPLYELGKGYVAIGDPYISQAPER